MNLSFSHLTFLFGLVVYLAIRAFFQRKLKGTRRSQKAAPVQDRLLVLLVIIGQIVLPLMLLFSNGLDWANIILPESFVYPGIVFFAAGIGLFWKAHSDLGKNWSVMVAIEDNHQLITNGVFKRIRHPMYASFFLMAVAQGLLLKNWFAGGAALVAMSLMYAVRVGPEEQMMIEHFGTDYLDYMKRTGRVFPRFR